MRTTQAVAARSRLSTAGVPPFAFAAAGAAAAWLMLSDAVELAAVVARFAIAAGVLVAVGALFVVLVIASRGGAAERAAVARLAGAGIAVAAAGSVASFATQVSATAGHGWMQWPGRNAFEATAEGRAAVALTVRLLGLALLALAAGRLRSSTDSPDATPAIAAQGAVVALAAFLVAGHGATRAPAAVSGAITLAHTLAASVWVGGLAAMFLVVRARSCADDAAGRADALQRFMRVMSVAIVVLFATGVSLSRMQLGSFNPTQSPYGAVLLAKIGLACAALTLGVYQHRRGVARLNEATGDEVPAQKFLSLTRVEVAVLGGVLMMTAWLAGTAT